ncbi:MAG: hypothetical protein HQL51_06415 [Magnetococcales bacterium]|nr:hypothetical protein [Magnetococcales bacterium]
MSDKPRVELRQGDMFEGDWDCVVLPCSTDGGTDDITLGKINTYNLPHPPDQLAIGTTKLYNYNKKKICYAACIHKGVSDTAIIERIGQELGQSLSGVIHAPLLGKLPYEDSLVRLYVALKRGFESGRRIRRNRLIIFERSMDDYVKLHWNIIQSGSSNSKSAQPVFKTTANSQVEPDTGWITGDFTGKADPNTNFGSADLNHSSRVTISRWEADPLEPKILAQSRLLSQNSVIPRRPDSYKGENLPPAIKVDQLALEISHIINQTADSGRNIATISSNKADKRMVGIFGRWGRGKTYLIRQIIGKLKNRALSGTIEWRVVEFNAWRYQETPAIWAFLYQTILNEFQNDFTRSRLKILHPLDRGWNNVWTSIKINHQRQGWLPVLLLLAGISLSIYGSFSLLNDSGLVRLVIDNMGSIAAWLFSGGGLLIVFKLLRTYWKYKQRAADLVQEYTRRFQTSEYLGAQSELQEELKWLLQAWVRDPDERRILLVVDDLDRCREKKLIEIIDSLRVILEEDDISRRVVIMAAVDKDILEQAIAWKYRQLKDMNSSKVGDRHIDDLAIEYLDKLFIFSAGLGNLSADEREEIILLHLDTPTVTVPPSQEDAPPIAPSPAAPANEEEPMVANQAKRSMGGFFGVVQLLAPVLPEILMTGNQNDPPALPPENNSRIAENELIIEAIRSFDTATPRQIRIFYYRYLFLTQLDATLLVGEKTERHQEGNETKARMLLSLVLLYTNPALSGKRYLVMNIFLSEQDDLAVTWKDLMEEYNQLAKFHFPFELLSTWDLDYRRRLVSCIEIAAPY